MSNSPLVSYTKISPNKTSPRKHKIDTITIHCVVGQVTVEQLGAVFAPTQRKASSNYGVGKDGRIGMYVEEKDRSWCSSNYQNDDRAITIEVASDTKHPYAVTDAAYKGLIDLLVDICQRNDIKELKWKADKSLVGNVEEQNMTVHRWFAYKACPGDYLYERHGQIAAEVNARLGVTSPAPSKPADPPKKEETAAVVFKAGDVVTLDKGAVYYHNNAKVPDWVIRKQWIVREVKGDCARIDKSVDGVNSINSPVNVKYLNLVTAAKTPEPETDDKVEVPFKVQVSIPNLNIRKGPGTNYDARGYFTGVGIFTIIDVKPGKGSSAGWGLLKSYSFNRDGWIALDCTKRV